MWSNVKPGLKISSLSNGDEFGSSTTCWDVTNKSVLSLIYMIHKFKPFYEIVTKYNIYNIRAGRCNELKSHCRSKSKNKKKKRFTYLTHEKEWRPTYEGSIN